VFGPAGVPDSGQQISQRIGTLHERVLPNFLKDGYKLNSPGLPGHHQLAFTTPGISPLKASSLKQMRHNPKSRMYPRGLPQRLHLLCLRTGNLGFLLDFSIKQVLAKCSPQRLRKKMFNP
jgi:hypothetical protein